MSNGTMDNLEARMTVLETADRDEATTIDRVFQLMEELDARLRVIERKTHGLADRNPQTNCRHCGKLVNNPQATRCPLCNKTL